MLKKYGYTVVEPACGRLACGDTGAGKMPEPGILIDYVRQLIERPKDMAGLRLLVTAGPTQEALDPVRYLTNHSSGKMGYALACEAAKRGAKVTLVSGPTALEKPLFTETVDVVSAKDMFEAVAARQKEQDIIIKAAAVADYRPSRYHNDKIKKADGSTGLELSRTDDILLYLGEHKKSGQYLCGFSMETANMLENSQKKLKRKNADMIVANNLKVDGAGFAGDTNIVTIITRQHITELPCMSKEEVANQILDYILQERGASMNN